MRRAGSARLDRSGRVLDSLDLRSFETWALGGIRAAENDPERRLRFFALLDTQALHAIEHGADSIAFTDVESELKAFIAAHDRVFVVEQVVGKRLG